MALLGLAALILGLLFGLGVIGNIHPPSISLPNVNLPNINLPNLNLPNINLPNINLPNLNPNLNINGPKIDV